MEIETSSAERPVIAMPVGGFEVASGIEARRVPESATEVGDEGEFPPELCNLGDKDGVLVDGTESVVERILLLFDASRSSIDAHPLCFRHGHDREIANAFNGFFFLCSLLPPPLHRTKT